MQLPRPFEGMAISVPFIVNANIFLDMTTSVSDKLSKVKYLTSDGVSDLAVHSDRNIPTIRLSNLLQLVVPAVSVRAPSITFHGMLDKHARSMVKISSRTLRRKIRRRRRSSRGWRRDVRDVSDISIRMEAANICHVRNPLEYAWTRYANL